MLSYCGNRLYRHSRREQHGSAMVMTLFILAILTMVGLLAARSTTTEVQMAANELRHRQAFYAAEGVAELVSEVLEQNIACPGGFTENTERGGLVQVDTPDFWKNQPVSTWLPSDESDSASFRDMRIPVGTNENAPHADVFIGGEPTTAAGNALQSASGYDGIGRSAASHGTHILYDQIIRHHGHLQTEAAVRIRWRHVVGMEEPCTP